VPPSEVLTTTLAALVRREDLVATQIDDALGEILAGRVSDVQAAAFAIALRAKGETSEELAALVRTMLRFAEAVDVGPGAIDTCGTGGDRHGTVNVSTMAALVAAGAGVRVVKHGNRAASSQCGSADVLEALGVEIDLGPEGVARCVDRAGIGFCFARRYHAALRFLGPARAELGVPTTFNFLGPLANPARVRRQSLGVSDPEMATRMLGVLAELGTERALVFHGDDGLDELTTTTTSTVHELGPDGVRSYTVDPTEHGIGRATLADLRGGDASCNADAVRRVLDGEPGPVRDIAVLNTGAALVVGGAVDDLGAGIAAAGAAIDDGRARRALDLLVQESGAGAARERAGADGGA
jgi:anthranilate phosphoribosyltransferase